MRAAVILSAVALLATACGSDPAPAGAPADKTLTVFAASSLTEAFTTLARQFEAAHPGVTVKFNFGGSSALVQQLTQGAKADVFASADQANMDKGIKGGVIDGEPAVFATNKLTIAVGKGNPHGIKTFADLAKDGLKVVVCAPQVPCGAAEQKVESAAKVDLKPVSEEQDVKAVLAKVTSGDADAGLVYMTDVNPKIDKVDFPESSSAINKYPIAAIKGGQPDLANAFTNYILLGGRPELTKAGFGSP